jgi:MFS family permease
VRLLLGEGASTVGDQIWYVALSWAAVRSGGPATAGAVMTASAIPRMLLLLFAGPLADRFDARRLMIGSDAARAVLMLGAAALAVPHPGVGMLVAVSLVLGAIDAVFLPAAGSVRPRLLETEQLPQAAALRELALRGALVAGAPLGGLLVASGGLGWACALNALSFALSMAAVHGIRPRPLPVEDAVEDAVEVAAVEDGAVVGAGGAAGGGAGKAAARTSYFASLRDGLSALVRNRVVSALLLVGLLTNLGFVGPMNVGLALLSDQRGWGAGGIGMLLAAFGIGAAAGSALLLRWRVTRQIGAVVAVAVLAQAGALAAMALLPALPAATAAAALVGASGAVVGVSCGALGQARTPDDQQRADAAQPGRGPAGRGGYRGAGRRGRHGARAAGRRGGRTAGGRPVPAGRRPAHRPPRRPGLTAAGAGTRTAGTGSPGPDRWDRTAAPRPRPGRGPRGDGERRL